jgi:hypothetical protein
MHLADPGDTIGGRYERAPRSTAKELVREQDGRTKLLWSSDPLRKDGQG